VIFGTYVVREIEAPRGYVLNETLYLVTITEDGQVIQVEIENRLIRGNVEGVKIGEDSEYPFCGMFADGAGLAGATIGIFGVVELEAGPDAEPDTEEAQDEDGEYPEVEAYTEYAGDEYTDQDKPEDEEEQDAPEVIILSIAGVPLEEFVFLEAYAVEVAVTAEDGSFAFRDLPFGIYVVREIQSPEGYTLNETLYLVTIAEDGEVIVVEIENTLIRGTVEGVKVDEEGDGLAGAVIGLFRSTEEVFTAETALLVVESGEDGGFAFEDLIFGEYLVREIKAPEGHVLSDTLFPITITEDGEVIEILIENRLIRGSVEGVKVEADTGEPLQGAVFGLFPGDAAEFTEEAALELTTSDYDGAFTFADLIFGAYIIRELKAPEGYILSNESFAIQITEDG